LQHGFDKADEKEAFIPEFLSGGGEMGRRIREFDWSATLLGSVHTWPQNLRTCIRIMLDSRQPIWIGWGKELINLYNDPYRDIVRGKHPWALGKPAEIVWREIWPTIEPMLRQVMEMDEGTYVESQFLMMERNGYPEETYYTFSYTPIPGDTGGTAGMICFNTDDTDRIISERQLNTLTRLGKNLTGAQAAAEVIQRTIDSLRENPHDFPGAAFYQIAGDHAVLANNTEQPGAAGGSNRDAEGLPPVIALNDHSGIGLAVSKSFLNRQPQILEDAARDLGNLPHGAWSVPPTRAVILPIIQSGMKDPFGFILTGLNPYRLPDEKYTGFFSLLADQVTTSFGNIHNLEAERKRVQALAEIDQAKTIFFSNISHELRTPLTLLLGPIEEAMNEADDIAGNRHRLLVAHRNALRMQKLVNNLLEFSRIEAGRAEGRFTPVDIVAYTAELASSFRSAIEKAGLQLHLEPGQVDQPVYVDPGMFEKIILNLVSNAFKYTMAGSITVSVREGKGEVRISVEDTGIGIPESQLDLIFERFHRVENASVRSQEGTGIGLSLVRELVRIHQGRIDVKSHPGTGSTFTVTLPTGKGHLPPERIAETDTVRGSGDRAVYVSESLQWLPDATTHAGFPELPIPSETDMVREKKKFIVLLADDNADMREYMGRLLSRQYEVVSATNGEDAYLKMLSVKPDLILTDVMMPKLDGFGLLQKVRQHPEFKTTPVILLSARAGEESRVEGLEAGADDYLVKPFSARELIARVDANLRINSARRLVEQELSSFLLQAPFAIIILSGPDYLIDLANDKYLPIIRHTREEVMGRPMFDVVPEALDQGYKAFLDDIRRTGEAASMHEQETFLFREGRTDTVYLTIAYQPLKNRNGVVERIMIVVEDVTETVVARRKIEQHAGLLEAEVKKRTGELLRLNTSLQQSNEDLRQFAHVASHDLREPVRKVKVYSGRLQEDPGTEFSAKGRAYLEKIDSAANRMLTMIEGVLHFSTINSTQQETEPVDLDKVIRSIESDLELLILQKKAKLNYSRLPTVEGAPLLLYQLFYNLINNSLKFARMETPCRIDISSAIEKDQAVIQVADNGIGFDQDQSEHIFDTFSRLNAKDKYEGTGLGLSLCKKIVQRHGGEIRATGKKGEGSEFHVSLPLQGGIGHLI